MLRYQLILESSASSKKRRKREKPSAKTSQALVGCQKSRLRKRSAVRKKKLKQKKKRKRSVFEVLPRIPHVLTTISSVGC